MSTKEKLLERFNRQPSDFTFDELITLMGFLGFKIDNLGVTSGSRLGFKREDITIKVHKTTPRKNSRQKNIEIHKTNNNRAWFMGRLRYKGYSGTVEYDESVGHLVGKILGLKKALILYEGNSIEELQKDFEEAVDDYLESCKADGVNPEQPYSGKLVLRMSSKLHGAAAEKAEKEGISLNEFITRAISAAVL